MSRDSTMAALARVNPTIAQPAFRANDPIAEVRLKASETPHSTTSVNANASSSATNFYPPIISVSMESMPWKNTSHPYFRNSTAATSSAHSALLASMTSPGSIGALPSTKTTQARPAAPTLAQTLSANSTLLTGTGMQARGRDLSLLLAAVVILSFLWFL
ncbi:hypothetical protein ASPBRDRAFT_60029 [Aspergillus brasiliensis CBS 101740]|uniref:Uncharacterized protein n=1 Tax=Aspergillus brasiliensis (strain CBS 101740 / IMI 381727 / IBT 21946) TaxID=767769 RepID=A0A1L9U3C9_ASPBC|nr:hypothetical protein ASPBRDRAFT_60029 [Aspergillus brasiliensis CBS 101740]